MSNDPNHGEAPSDGLDVNSYTHGRLSHATPEHLHLTSRRCFIGPIPKGWLNSHRKEWYKQHLHINYSSRAATFSASQNVTHTRRVTGLDGAHGHGQSFRQPEDVSEHEETTDAEEEAPTAATPPIPVPAANGDIPHTDRPRSNEEDIVEGATPLDKTASVESEALATSPQSIPQRNGGFLSPPTHGSKKSVRRKSRPSHDEESTRTGSFYVDAPEFPGQAQSPRSQKLTVQIQSPELQKQSSGSPKLDRSPVTSFHNKALSAAGSDLAGDDASTCPLIPRVAKSHAEERAGNTAEPEVGEEPVLKKLESAPTDEMADDVQSPLDRLRNHINFDIPEDSRRAFLKSRMAQLDVKKPFDWVFKRHDGMDGRIHRMERMLVRLDITRERKLPDDFDENSGEGVITQTIEKWREFMVVCRQASKAEDSDFVLQIYKTRVIPAVEDSQTRKKAAREIPLGKKYARVNLYSSLDKSVVIWVPDKHGTKIIILRPRTMSGGVEWFTFLRGILGIKRTSELLISVPDLGVNLRLEDPFHDLEEPADAKDGENEEEAAKAPMREQVVARRIINQCLEMLKSDPQWAGIIENWFQAQMIGLAWKRYDRLEWIHGVNERKMYGSIAMIKSHELELRPKQHYATNVQTRKGKDLKEPAPIEGFLIRLTSQKGAQQRMGKLFFKRLYFHTHDQYLFFSKPGKADPPPPPQMSDVHGVPKARQITDSIPLIYAVNPYPVEDGTIVWLGGSVESIRHHDEDAFDEYRRKVANLTTCDGYIDLCNVKKVRKIHRGNTPADSQTGETSDTDFDADGPEDWDDEDGETEGIHDDASSFELVLKNGLVVRLQAYDKQTKKEWKQRLRALVKYWRHRHPADIDLLKSVRKQNLDELQIDEETEAVIGQFAKKWEVTKSVASAELYNMCGISCCRTIHLSGSLYRKPRLHSVFTATQAILIPGKLLLFSTALRTRTGKGVKHIHQDKLEEVDLKDVYLYAGLLTENDLLYQNMTFDANNPGHHALPRMWVEDEWTSRDEDVMSCFVIWRPLNKGWFRAPGSGSAGEGGGIEGSGKRARLKRVSQLGATGRSMVLKARSRVERDRWVLAISTEIERLGGGEDVRITDDGSGKKG